MPVGIDPGDPRGGGISPVEAVDGTGLLIPISFDESMREVRRGARREDELTMDELDAWQTTRLETIQTVVRAYGLPEEIVFPRAEYDDLIESTRAEFPPDRYEYGRYTPQGPMRWTPPENGEEVPRWLA